MPRFFALFAFSLAYLTSVATGQTLDYTAHGTITAASAGTSPEIWDPVQVGHPFSVTYRVDTTTSTSFNDGTRAIYTDPILAVIIDINGVQATLTSLIDTSSQVSDNRVGGSSCIDDFELLATAGDFDVDMINMLLSEIDGLASCPTTTIMGVTYPSVVNATQFTNAASIELLTTAFGVFAGNVTSVEITPANDDCADAITLPATFADTPYNASGATTDGASALGFCDYGQFGDQQNHKDIWFEYTPAVGGCTYISTFGLAGYDTRITVYEGASCPDDPASIIACVDDEDFNAPFEAGLDVTLVAGSTYTIRVGTYNTGTVPGAGTLRVGAGPGAAINSGGNNPGAPGCDAYISLCNGDGGDEPGCILCPCANTAANGTTGGCLNSAGTSARLIGTGLASVSLPSGDATDLRFSLTGAPPGAFCILNSGDSLAPGNMANPCFGFGSGGLAAVFDGLRCAIVNTRRHGGRPADANGDVGLTNNPWGGEGGPPVGIANAGPGYVAGQTRFFQVINRDDVMLGCMRGLNTSQAVRVTFTP